MIKEIFKNKLKDYLDKIQFDLIFVFLEIKSTKLF